MESMYQDFLASGGWYVVVIETQLGHFKGEINFRDMTMTDYISGQCAALRRILLHADTGDWLHVSHFGFAQVGLELAANKQHMQRLAQLEVEKEQRASLEAERGQWWEAKCAHLEAQNQRLLKEQGDSNALQEIEAWRHMGEGSRSVEAPYFNAWPCLVDCLQNMLYDMIPVNHQGIGTCARASSLKVDRVQTVVNPSRWRQYSVIKQNIADALRQRPECPWIDNIAPQTTATAQFLKHVQLDPDANEVLLLHGTSREDATQICLRGFDDRLGKESNLYGAGTYFTTDACKAIEYSCKKNGTGPCCVIVARVALGHPYMATGPLQGYKRPPLVEGTNVPHDSTIATPGIPGHKGNAQVHWEFVVQSTQAFPDLIVDFHV